MVLPDFNDAAAVTTFTYLSPPVDPDPLWAFNEFAGARLQDERLTRRLQELARQFVHQPLASIPQACGSWAQSKAAYRFCANAKVSLAAILAPHYQCTAERAGWGSPPVILCPTDTTTLSYLAHPATQGLGHLGTRRGKSLGFFVHSTLAVSPQGEFFGLLHVHCWSRSKGRRGRRRRRRQPKALAQKETCRWLQSFWQVEAQAQQNPTQRWVSVGDREGDLFELFQAATQPTCRAGLLVRARHDRRLIGSRGKKKKQTLFKYLRRLPEGGQCTVQVPRHDDQPARQAILSVRWSAVSLAAPRYHEGQAPVQLWAVWAQEIDPPAGQKPIRWCLLTTVPVHTLQDALERLEWYTKRWTIEEYHRVLKSGCHVEARQLSSRERLQRALAIDMVVAWRMMDLNKAARLEPDAPADRWLSTVQWQALYCYWHHTTQVPATPPTIAQAVLWIAQLGGFLARKSDGSPGPTTLWRGLQRLHDIVESWQAFGPEPSVPEGRKSRRRKPKRCG